MVDEVWCCIQVVIAQEPPGAAVSVVRARLGHQVRNRAGTVAVLRGVVERKLLELLYRILDRSVDVATAEPLVRNAVNQEAIEVLA